MSEGEREPFEVAEKRDGRREDRHARDGPDLISAVGK